MTRVAECWRLYTLGLALVLAPAMPGHAQEFSLNSDTLSFVEEPLAFEALGFTVYYNQLVDQPVSFDFNDEDVEFKTRTDFQLAIERQLPNALTVGATYFGTYQRDGSGYEDKWGVFGRGVWGRVAVGEVTETTREATRRVRGAGNAVLAFDDVLGSLDDDAIGGAYSLRISAYTLYAAVDDDFNTDIGVAYNRPGQFMDYRLTARFTRGETGAVDDDDIWFDTHAATFVGEIEYGSLIAGAGAGIEWLDADGADGTRVFVSGGVNYKVQRLTLSAEGHYGVIDGDPEVSAAAGARYDIARGLSANLGYNYARSYARIDGIKVRDTSISEIIGSMRYEF